MLNGASDRILDGDEKEPAGAVGMGAIYVCPGSALIPVHDLLPDDERNTKLLSE